MTQRLTAVVARRVRKLRDEQRLSAQALADACAGLGNPAVNRDVIANLESGRRATITVDEVFVLALALNVAPTHLLADPDDPEPVSVSGRVEVSNRVMRAWLASRAPLPGEDPRKFAGQAVPWLEDLPAVDEEGIAAWRKLDEVTRRLLPPIEDGDEGG